MASLIFEYTFVFLRISFAPTDVANAFYSLAVSEKTTGTILTVDGGNVAASFR